MPHVREAVEDLRIAVAGNDAHEVAARCPQSATLQPAANLDSTESYKSGRFGVDVVGFEVEVISGLVVNRLH
jgi:hypothetical protein